jgi:hypothetical protein
MKFSSGKLQFWERKKPPVGAGTFCPSPILVLDIAGTVFLPQEPDLLSEL